MYKVYNMFRRMVWSRIHPSYSPPVDGATSGIKAVTDARVRKVVAHPQGPSVAAKSLLSDVVEGLHVIPRVPRHALAAVIDKRCAHSRTVCVCASCRPDTVGSRRRVDDSMCVIYLGDLIPLE